MPIKNPARKIEPHNIYSDYIEDLQRFIKESRAFVEEASKLQAELRKLTEWYRTIE